MAIRKGTLSTARAYVYIDFEHLIQHDIGFHPGIFRLETTMILYAENDTETLFLHAICEKPVIADLLETFWKDVLKEAPNKLHV